MQMTRRQEEFLAMLKLHVEIDDVAFRKFHNLVRGWVMTVQFQWEGRCCRIHVSGGRSLHRVEFLGMLPMLAEKVTVAPEDIRALIEEAYNRPRKKIGAY